VGTQQKSRGKSETRSTLRNSNRRAKPRQPIVNCLAKRRSNFFSGMTREGVREILPKACFGKCSPAFQVVAGVVKDYAEKGGKRQSDEDVANPGRGKNSKGRKLRDTDAKTKYCDQLREKQRRGQRHLKQQK